MSRSMLVSRWPGSHAPMVTRIISTGTREVSIEGYNLKGWERYFLERRSLLLKVIPLGIDHMSPCGFNLCIYFVSILFSFVLPTQVTESHNEWPKCGEIMTPNHGSKNQTTNLIILKHKRKNK